MSRLPSWLAAVTLVIPLAAQLPIGSVSAASNQLNIPWTPAGSGPVRRVFDLFWGSGHHRAVIGLRGAGLGLAPAPAVTPCMRNLDLGFSVVDGVPLEGAGLPGTAPAKTRDALLVSVLGNGPELVVAWTDANGATCTNVIDLPEWFRASLLESARRPSGNLVAGRSQGGDVLLRAMYTQGVFTPLPSISVGAQITDLCCSNDEVAVLTATGITIYAANGSIVYSATLAHAGGAIAPLREPGASGVVQLRRDAPGTGWELVRIMGATADAPVAVTFGNGTFGGLSTGDFDGDDRDDPAVQDNSNQLRLVLNDAVTALAGATLQMAVGPTGAVQQPADTGDLDYDGNDDVFMAMQLPNGQWTLVVVVGTRSQLNPGGETYGEIFTGCYHELMDPMTLNVDWFKLGILWEELPAFDTMMVTYYSGDQESIEGGALAAEFDTATYSLPLPAEQMAGIHLPVHLIEQPNLLFLKVQFSSTTNPDVRPFFLAGATIDDLPDDQEDLNCPYLEDHKPPDAVKKPVWREFPGRKYLGLLIRQTSLPASTN